LLGGSICGEIQVLIPIRKKKHNGCVATSTIKATKRAEKANIGIEVKTAA